VDVLTLAFIESPIALIALFVIILICFGPNKVPEIASQLGRALGELKRATNGFQQSLKLGEHDTSYPPTNYDSYSNPTDYSSGGDYSSSASVSEDDLHRSGSNASGIASEPPHGDFAASALADTGDEYTYTSPTSATNSTPKPAERAQELTTRPAESTVPRNS